MSEPLRVLGMIDEVYYAPQIVAFRNGYFADEGLEVEFNVGELVDLSPAVASGKADVALCGLWQPWLYAEQFGAPLVAFAEINQQVPLFLFAREPADRWDTASLEGGTFLHTSVMAASPWVALQELLHVHDIDLNTLRLVLGNPPAQARELFKGGYGDLLELFGLGAAPFLADPDVHSVGAWSRDLGTIPSSIYYATRDALKALEPEIVAFTRALARALQWIRASSANEVTGVVAPWFESVDEDAVGHLVEAFLASEQWPATPEVEPVSTERWRTMLVRSGLLQRGSDYLDIVEAEIAASVLSSPR